MIVRMSKIVIIGAKDRLMDVLHHVHELGFLHIEPDIKSVADENLDPYLKALSLDEKTVSERLFCENLKNKIDTLLECIPDVPSRKPYLSPQTAAKAIAEIVSDHIESCRSLFRKRESLQEEKQELNRYGNFLIAVESLLPPEGISPDLDCIGIEISGPEVPAELEKFLEQHTQGRFELLTTQAGDDTIIGLITTEKEFAAQLRARLNERRIAEYTLPEELKNLSLTEQNNAILKRLAACALEINAVDEKLTSFSKRWLGTYRLVRRWLSDRLRVIQSTASIYETELCFFILGWLPTTDLERLKKNMEEKFAGKVVVEEKEILEQDLERVPTMLKNPAYFQPFEIFARLLPMPAYSSFDITPFIGIFFPIFFGMMLGDIGYGIVVLAISLLLLGLYKRKKLVTDAAKILGVCGAYTIFFGILFGECFGTVGRKLFGLKPIIFDRHAAIEPMFYFALAAGVVHIIIALAMGLISALRKKLKREALFKLFTILFILCLAFIGASFWLPTLTVLKQPLLITIGIITPVLLVTGGLMAPLEVIKSIGNIISYARIMAIGLTSVLLAYVANNFAGMAGSIWIGVFVAILLHAFNILLGIFAPTIHSLRLHYVEFLSKFMETGGKEYKPLGRE